MTSILNKLVSACQTIEANGGSGGGSSGSEPEYATSKSTLNKSSFTSIDYCFVPICAASEKHAEAQIYIRVNNLSDLRYYIEVVYDTNIETHYCVKVFKNTASASDSTELTFGLVQCSHSAVDGSMICLKVGGISTITSETFIIPPIVL